MQPTLRSCLPEFERQLSELEQLASQSAVHRKKFEFAVNQFRRFLLCFSQDAKDDPITPDQEAAYRSILDILRELHQLLCQYQLHCWSHTTLENPCNSVATTLCQLTSRLQKLALKLHENSSKAFEIDSPQWMQYHILDLRGIAASFNQYIQNCAEDDPVADLINERLDSVNTYLKQYENETINSGLRVFSPIPVIYQKWQVNLDDFEVIKEIGAGVSSHVFYGKYKKTDQEVAIKRLKFKKLSGLKLASFQREVSVLATCCHPCLIGFVGATDTPPFCIVTEWMPNDTLYHDLHKHHKLDTTMRTIAAFDIARGMQELHSKHIIHRDLKSLNVLLDKDYHVHICDFGFSRGAGEEQLYTQNVGTPHWMAPELLDSSHSYNYKVDVYAYGIVLWEIMTCQLPYSGLESTQIIAQVMMNDLRPSIPESTNGPLRDLTTSCWDRNPDRRPTFDEIIRRFQTNEITLNGADKEMFVKYMEEKIGKVGMKQAAIEDKISQVNDDEAALQDLIDFLEKNGLPNDLVYKCWETVERNVDGPPKNVGRAAAFFLTTAVKTKAAAVIRMLPAGSVPAKLLMPVIELIPSGLSEFDADITIAACKNGAADVCVVYVVNQTYLKLAMEVVSQQGASPSLKAAVADRCVQCLSSNDHALIMAATRCLIGIGDARRISCNLIENCLKSDDDQLRNCMIVAAAASASTGSQLSIDIIDTVFQEMSEGSEIAEATLVAACKSPHSAIQVVNRIAFLEHIPRSFALRIMLLAAQYDEVRPVISVALQMIKMEDETDQFLIEAYNKLKKCIPNV
ncbi:TKL family protein kinase [Trichomonas vaginalis G3]|uniref:TKL family protein kinase n=1 Tax=Trichomonas vaginalis (strain ATCC PRA-98 / G3) TaxID=412133 RepID=A2EJ21_TRIV3|nr:protein kinase protein [Trichomonas vaginalis G3]EAY07324.1 TKL family protein kinase [Trichomonas vaginalis G3]KAI5524497.1 protein kinase protein [Trichomonas vaginalis G3]|eukprot:XP_001319547.1 TKL family protein kinase [Trichomonas vaginalis G3]